MITAPARIILNFAADSRESMDLTLVSFARGIPDRAGSAPESDFIAAARKLEIPIQIIRESGRFDFGAVRQLARLVECLKPDLVQTNAVKSHFLVSLLRRRSFRWIAFHHGYTREDLKMRLYNRLDRFSLKRCDRIVTVCEPFAQQLTEQGIAREKISVVPNSIAAANFLRPDPALAAEWRTRLGIASDERVVLSIGRLSPEKGHRYLIDAASLLVKSGQAPKLKVLIAGTGVLEASLAEQIAAAGAGNSVKLIGFHADVKPLFMIADLFVLPSLSEGSPMVLLESMAARVPVIATNVGGIPETVAGGDCADLVSPGDPGSLSRAILAALLEPQRAHRKAELAFEHVRHSFSPAIYNGRILSIFRRVIANG